MQHDRGSRLKGLPLPPPSNACYLGTSLVVQNCCSNLSRLKIGLPPPELHVSNKFSFDRCFFFFFSGQWHKHTSKLVITTNFYSTPLEIIFFSDDPRPPPKKKEGGEVSYQFFLELLFCLFVWLFGLFVFVFSLLRKVSMWRVYHSKAPMFALEGLLFCVFQFFPRKIIMLEG